MHPSLSTLALSAVLLLIPRSALHAGNIPSAAEIVQKLEERAKAIRNARCTALYEQFVDGTPTRWTRSTTHFDDQGPEGEVRAKHFLEHGVYEDEKRVPQKSECFLYNGHITIHFRYNERIFLQGIGTKAMVSHGPEPGAGGPLSIQNPLRSLPESLLSELKAAERDGRAVRIVQRHDDSEGLYEIHFRRTLDEEHWFDDVMVVDENRFWIPISGDRTNRDGVLVLARTAKYTDVSGTWMPTEGSTKWFLPSTFNFRTPQGEPKQVTIPASEWRFRVEELSLNAPDFPGDLFQIVLEPGTSVWDKRYLVDYRVGRERAFEDDLVRLAEEARARQGRAAEIPE